MIFNFQFSIFNSKKGFGVICKYGIGVYCYIGKMSLLLGKTSLRRPFVYSCLNTRAKLPSSPLVYTTMSSAPHAAFML